MYRDRVKGWWDEATWAFENCEAGDSLRYLGWRGWNLLRRKLPEFGGPPSSRLGRSVRIRVRGYRKPEPVIFSLSEVSLYTFWQIYQKRMYDLSIGHPVHSIVDLGANIGLASRWLGSKFPDSKVVCVEPEEGNLGILENNLKLMGRGEVEAACVHARDGSVELTLSPRSDSHFVAEAPSDHSRRVAAVSMPTLMAKHGLKTIDLIKCDIEGAEASVFTEDATWLDRVGAVILEIHPDRYPLRTYTRVMEQHGFTVTLSPSFDEDRLVTAVRENWGSRQ